MFPLDGGNDDDTLIAQGGNNLLWSGSGKDRFAVGLGSGLTTIYTDDAEGPDTLVFGEGIRPDMLHLEKSGDFDLQIRIGEDYGDVLDAQEGDKQFLGEEFYLIEALTAPPAWTGMNVRFRLLSCTELSGKLIW